jgi:diphosphoinositol-polyphosphate diphosphatase
VRGELEEPLIGRFPFHSGKAEQAHSAHAGRCVAYLFAMHVTEVLPVWPEGGQRQREWCSLEEACRRCRYDWMREALVAWMRRKGWDAAAAACQLQSSNATACGSSPVQLPAAVMAAGAQVSEVVVPAPVERVAVRT